MTEELESYRLGRAGWAVLAAMALVWLLLAVSSASVKSATVDEVPHFGAGLSALHFFDFRMNPEHPPLVKVLAALPVYVLDRPDMRAEDETNFVGPWFDGLQSNYGWFLLYYSDELWAKIDGRESPTIPHMRRLMLARAVPILIGLLGGWLAFLWGRELTRSAGGGICAAALLLFYPEYLGHARFLTFDVPMAVCFAALSWFGLQFLKRPSWRSGALFVVAAMLGSQVKLPVAVFTVMLLGLLLALSFVPRQRLRPLVVAALIVATAVGGVFAAWAGAGFRFSFRAPEETPTPVASEYVQFEGLADAEGLLPQAIHFAWSHRLLPETTLATLKHVTSFESRLVFLNGTWQREGWYIYFFETFLLKTPIPMIVATLLLLGGALRFSARPRGKAWRWRIARGSLLWAATLGIFAVVVLSRTNLGHRYILFIYFPLSVALGAWTWRWLRAGVWRRYAAAALLVTQFASVLVSWPHYATYFNAAVGDAYHGSRYVADSNVDWGQDLPAAADALEELGAPSVNLAVFGYNRPENYGITNYRWLLDRYPFAVNMPQAVEPDPTLPTIVSLNNLQNIRNLWPEIYNREPDVLLNSLVMYLPEP